MRATDASFERHPSIIGISPVSSPAWMTSYYGAEHVFLESYHPVFTHYLVQISSSKSSASIRLYNSYASTVWFSYPQRPTNHGPAWILLQPRNFQWPFCYVVISLISWLLIVILSTWTMIRCNVNATYPLLDMLRFRNWIPIVRRKAQAPNGFYHRRLIIER